MAAPPLLILASTSPYRRELLARLQPALRCRRAGGRRDRRRRRNARQPGAAPRARQGAGGGKPLPGRGRDRIRPGRRPRAAARSANPARMRRRSSNCAPCAARRSSFQTAVAVVLRQHRLLAQCARDGRGADARAERRRDRALPATRAGLRLCRQRQVRRPRHRADAAIRSDDPTALVGLPLIRTAELLRAAGCDPLAGGRQHDMQPRHLPGAFTWCRTRSISGSRPQARRRRSTRCSRSA